MPSSKAVSLFLFLLVSITPVFTWFSCSEVEFCSRIRDKQSFDGFDVDTDNLEISLNHISAELVNSVTGKYYSFDITALSQNIYRVEVNDPENPRHKVLDALDGEPKRASNVKIGRSDSPKSSITIETENSKAVLQTDPFSISFYYEDQLIAEINTAGKLVIEEEPDAALALDVFFPGAKAVYGIPSHPDNLSLTDTSSGDPYRLYNVDRAAYGFYEKQGLYGSIPVLYAHSAEYSSGFFWHNSAQTFVDVNKSNDGVQTYFMSESGALDFFVLTGPTLKNAVRQYAALTGVAPVPQYWALGYHQSRYSYESIDDVLTVVSEFDNNNFPLDAMWLDIDSTENFRYFTWNQENFGDPLYLQQSLSETGRKLVGIVDPHFAVDDSYSVYADAKANDYFVKNPNGTIYEDACWPGTSSWIDFFNPEARAYYSSLFAYDKFEGSTNVLHYWNDMNEPAVFGGYENSFPKEVVHYGGWTHRDVHNQFGFYQSMGTYQGLFDRANGEERPFVLSRSHFAGSQRYAAIWTGDSIAQWEQILMVAPMCLSSGLAGLSFCGSDIGGFFNNCPEHLLVRWYQLAAFTPFFRQHSNNNANRREPYLFEDDIQDQIRAAINLRYRHLPFWYTLFYEHYRTGDPLIRPLVYQYPEDENVFDLDQELMVGDAILVCPISEDNAGEWTCYLPGGQDQYWYDVENTLLYRGTGNTLFRVDMNSNLYFYRGGSIVPTRDTIRSASIYTLDDPVTVYVFLNADGIAEGTLYVDDTVSFNYQNKEYKYIRFTYNNQVLSTEKIDADASYDKEVIFDKTVIYRPPSGIKKARMSTQSKRVEDLEVTYSPGGEFLTIDNINHDLSEPLRIELQYE